MMKIGIILDNFSGHLFHDIELYIVAFSLLQKQLSTISEVHFIDYKIENKFKTNLSINLFLCKKYSILN